MGNQTESARGLAAVGIARSGPVYWNLGAAELYEHAIRREEAVIAADGPLVCLTGQHTGRSPNDKFFVRDASTEALINWGSVNREIDAASFDRLHEDMVGHLADKALYVLDAWAGADQAYRLSIRVVTELAWHNLFARNMFIAQTDEATSRDHEPSFTVIDAPSFRADPARHGTQSTVSCPDVPTAVLDPRTTWTDGAAYDAQARRLAAMFIENFKAFEADVLPSVTAAGPKS